MTARHFLGQIIFCVSLLNIASLAACSDDHQPNRADWTDAERQAYEHRCTVNNEWICSVLAARPGVQLYAQPRNDAKIIGEFPYWGASFVLDPDQKKVEGWVKVRQRYRLQKMNSPAPIFWSWVRRADVILREDYRRVVGCWPIKEVMYTLGDVSTILSFKTDGSVRVHGQQVGYDHLYLGGNSVVGVGGAGARFDFEKRSLALPKEALEGLLESEKHFTAQELAGCKEFPTLGEPLPPIKIPT